MLYFCCILEDISCTIHFTLFGQPNWDETWLYPSMKHENFLIRCEGFCAKKSNSIILSLKSLFFLLFFLVLVDFRAFFCFGEIFNTLKIS